MSSERDDLEDETIVLVEKEGERRIGTAEEVRVSSTDRGLLYGDSVFETLRCYDGAAAFLDRHVSRLNNGLSAAGFGVRFDAPEIKSLLKDVTESFGDRDAYVRVTVTRGDRDGLLAPTEENPTVLVHAKPLGRRQYSPATVETVTEPRPVGVLANHKTGCYLPNVVARGETNAETDEALMLTDGRVASGATSNVFVVREGRVETPRRRVRSGVTREVVLGVADDIGYETSVGEALVRDADAVFLTNTTWGVRGVEKVDGEGYDASHPVVEEFTDAYLERALESASQSL